VGGLTRHRHSATTAKGRRVSSAHLAQRVVPLRLQICCRCCCEKSCSVVCQFFSALRARVEWSMPARACVRQRKHMVRRWCWCLHRRAIIEGQTAKVASECPELARSCGRCGRSNDCVVTASCAHTHTGHAAVMNVHKLACAAR
jgi:hypothetical protein